MDIGPQDAIDGEFDQPVVDKDDGAGLNILIEPFERLMHATGSAGDVFFGEEEVVACAEQYRLVALKLAGADGGPFRIEHEGAGCIQFATDLFQAVHTCFVLGVGAM